MKIRMRSIILAAAALSGLLAACAPIPEAKTCPPKADQNVSQDLISPISNTQVPAGCKPIGVGAQGVVQFFCPDGRTGFAVN